MTDWETYDNDDVDENDNVKDVNHNLLKRKWRMWLGENIDSYQFRKVVALLHQNPSCCGHAATPLPKRDFNVCFPIFEHLARNFSSSSVIGSGIFRRATAADDDDKDKDDDKDDDGVGAILGYRIEIKSKLLFSLSFVKMKENHNLFEKTVEMLNRGWCVGQACERRRM